MIVPEEIKNLIHKYFDIDKHSDYITRYYEAFGKFIANSSNSPTKKQLVNHFLNSSILNEFLTLSLKSEFEIYLSTPDELSNIVELDINYVMYHLKPAFIQLCKEKGFCNSSLVNTYIKDSDTYKSLLENIIIHIYKETKNEDPKDIDVQYLFMKLKEIEKDKFSYVYLKNFISHYDLLDNSIRVQQLTNASTNDNHDDITNSSSSHVERLDKQNENNISIFKYFESTFQRNPSSDELTSILDILNNKTKLIDIVFNYSNFTNTQHFNLLTSMFRKIFNRDIYIQEFTKYYNESIEWKEYSEDKFEDFLKIKYDTFFQSLSITKHLYKVYLNKSIDEYFMISKHIDIFDSPQYESLLIDHIIELDDYNILMKKVIQQVYKKQFNENLLDYDLDYYFDILKSKKVHSESENFTELVCDLYEQTQYILKKISDTFEHILSRKPDILEVKSFLQQFRHVDTPDINDSLVLVSNNLYNSIEYIDILKNKVITCLEQTLYPSQLNQIMLHLIQNDKSHDLKKDDEALKVYVEQYIKNNFVN